MIGAYLRCCLVTCDSAGMSSSSTSRAGDRYDDDPAPRRSVTSGSGGGSAGGGGGRLDEIDDWNNGKKNMVGETIGKVKDFVNRMKGFDDTSDYG